MNNGYLNSRTLGVAATTLTLLLTACTTPGAELAAPTAAMVPDQPTHAAGLPNPASVYCEQQGYRLEIRTAPDGSQSGACLFPDGSECEEWAFYRGECGPGVVTPTPIPTAASAGLTPAAATALPTREGDYAGWARYAQTDYGFEFRYPPDWIVVPDDDPVSTLNGHALFVRPADEAAPVHLRVVVRRVGEDLLLWPTGVGEGEFVERDTTPFMGGWLRRVALVCQGHDIMVWYRSVDGGEIQHGDTEFSFILAYLGSCADRTGLSLGDQVIVNMIVASVS